MKKQITRRTILKAAGLGSVAAASVPALLPSLNALAKSPDNGHRIFVFVSFSQAKPTPKPLITSGFWEPTGFVRYDTKGLASFGKIQPAILTVLADFEGIGSGLTLELICNVGAVPLLTGEDEGWKLLDTPAYGTFVPLSPIVGITHLSVRGVSIDRGA